LVVYPVFRLRRLGLGVVDLVRALEEGVIRTLTDYGLEGFRRPDHPGVFTAAGKIASIGLAVRHNVSFHGLAFNYHPDLNHFRLINPCGLTDTPMTSASALLDRPLPHQEVRTRMAGHLARLLDLSYTPWTLEEAEAAAQGS
jgi:lipoyl(octanoyl) transferase